MAQPIRRYGRSGAGLCPEQHRDLHDGQLWKSSTVWLTVVNIVSFRTQRTQPVQRNTHELRNLRVRFGDLYIRSWGLNGQYQQAKQLEGSAIALCVLTGGC